MSGTNRAEEKGTSDAGNIVALFFTLPDRSLSVDDFASRKRPDQF